MQFRRDFRVGISILVALQVVTSFVAIALLGRMTPAVERILAENVSSAEAAEEMLATLVMARDEPSAANRARFMVALEKARSSITVSEEYPVLGQLERTASDALDGDKLATAEAVQALRRLIAVNHRVMRDADANAKRVGAAGEWAAALLALVSFAVSLVVVRLLSLRLLEPLAELYRVLEATRAGDRFRRCRLPGAGPDVRRILDGVNELIDRVQSRVSLGAG